MRTVRRACTLLGDSLVGLAVFGSWARGQLSDTSDVDVLVVINREVPVTRELYRRWDEASVVWDARPVEPHFLHLPSGTGVPSGLWAEVAMDGIVVFERDMRLSFHLSAVRRALVEGRLRRRVVHGQGYWMEGE